jgi:hypothetical protein
MWYGRRLHGGRASHRLSDTASRRMGEDSTPPDEGPIRSALSRLPLSTRCDARVPLSLRQSSEARSMRSAGNSLVRLRPAVIPRRLALASLSDPLPPPRRRRWSAAPASVARSPPLASANEPSRKKASATNRQQETARNPRTEHAGQREPAARRCAERGGSWA